MQTRGLHHPVFRRRVAGRLNCHTAHSLLDSNLEVVELRVAWELLGQSYSEMRVCEVEMPWEPWAGSKQRLRVWELEEDFCHRPHNQRSC